MAEVDDSQPKVVGVFLGFRVTNINVVETN